MKKIDLGQTIAILANLGVIAGIIFLAFELRQSTVATQIAAAQTVASSSADLYLEIFRDRELADMLGRVIRGEEIDDVERTQMHVLAAQTLRVWSNLYYQYQKGVLDEEMWKQQEQDIVWELENNYIMREHWAEDPDYYFEEFNSLMQSIFEEISVE